MKQIKNLSIMIIFSFCINSSAFAGFIVASDSYQETKGVVQISKNEKTGRIEVSHCTHIYGECEAVDSYGEGYDVGMQLLNYAQSTVAWIANLTPIAVAPSASGVVVTKGAIDALFTHSIVAALGAGAQALASIVLDSANVIRQAQYVNIGSSEFYSNPNYIIYLPEDNVEEVIDNLLL